MHASEDRGGRSIAKTRQLCAQVHDALSYALGDSSDPVLMDLVLDHVEPMQGAEHVLVVMQDPCGHGLVATLAALDRARGFLRDAVASSVNRRRVPRLSFTVLPAGGAR
ncbi:MAG: ribosome-binding factor A [Planctomycetes bacterium]|nr:ribosome-binding factor A [Planctomycetota bacterium]